MPDHPPQRGDRDQPERGLALVGRRPVRHGGNGNALDRRGFVPADHVREQVGKCDRRVVRVERTDYLRSDRQSERCLPDRRYYGWQARK